MNNARHIGHGFHAVLVLFVMLSPLAAAEVSPEKQSVLDWLGQREAAAAVMRAIEGVLEAGPRNAPLTRDIGGTAVLMLTWGDPAAELIGRKLGRPGRRKTLAGSIGCLLACLLAAWVGMSLGGLSPLVAVAGAVVATLAERWSPPPDDNVWLPLAAGLVMWGMQQAI